MQPSPIDGSRGAASHGRAGAKPIAGVVATACVLALAGGAAAGALPSTGTVQEICVGAQHSCARRDGVVACWGDNSDHQIAASTRPQFDAPRIVSEFPPAASLRCGTFETCVLTDQGAVHCLGGPSRAESLALGQPARDVILHERGGCALLRDGSVSCWSRPGTDGGAAPGPIRTLRAALGPSDGIAFVPAPPTATAVCVSRGSRPPLCFTTDGGAPAASAHAIFAGAADVVMARSRGTPLCARFGDGHVTCADAGAPAGASTPIAVPADLRVQGSLVPYDGGFCAQTARTGTERRLTCFGDKAALLRDMPANATTLALGDRHACAIAGGAIACWGAASYGQLGAGGSYLHARPLRVPGLTDAVQLDASTLQACALRRTGDAMCWGQSIDGSGRIETHFAPWIATLPREARAIRAAGPGATPGHAAEPLCARRSASAGKSNADGWQCLSQHGWKATALADRSGPLGGAKLSRVSRDGRCGLDMQDRLVCASPSATGTSPGRPRSVSVAAQLHFRDVASGLFDGGRAVVCGLTRDGGVLCFHVQDGAAAQPLSAPAALTGVTQLAAAGRGEDSVACALTAAGAVSCWGDGRFEQLGGATPAGALEAVSIAGLPPIAEIAVGGTFVCARTEAGELFCWGSNRDGTATDGATGASTVPLTVDVKWPREVPPKRR